MHKREIFKVDSCRDKKYSKISIIKSEDNFSRVKDEGGNWWYINTKAFILAEDIKVDVKLITMHDD
jgi:hypothetical protein